MTPWLSVFTIINNEEELLSYCLDSYCDIVDLLTEVSLVDNNSTDATLDIIESYKTKLPIILQHHRNNSRHGELRDKALSVCKGEYVFYLDSDETTSNDFGNWLRNTDIKQWDWVRFFKYTTIKDKWNFVPGGNDYSQRLFKNYPGVNFPQSVHTEMQYDWRSRHDVPRDRVLLFDATACKSPEALYAKAWKYQWAAREKVVGIGPVHEYHWRVTEAYRRNLIERFPDDVIKRITWGPESSVPIFPEDYNGLGVSSQFQG